MKNRKIDWLKGLGPNLADSAESLLRGGVALTVQDWLALAPSSRQALISAGNLIRSEYAALSGLASHGIESYARVAALADGGETAAELALARERERLVGEITDRAPALPEEAA